MENGVFGNYNQRASGASWVFRRYGQLGFFAIDCSLQPADQDYYPVSMSELAIFHTHWEEMASREYNCHL
jgi:hypothetical protein